MSKTDAANVKARKGSLANFEAGEIDGNDPAVKMSVEKGIRKREWEEKRKRICGWPERFEKVQAG